MFLPFVQTALHLPIELSSEVFGLRQRGRLITDKHCEKYIEPYHLEEEEVVTRFP